MTGEEPTRLGEGVVPCAPERLRQAPLGVLLRVHFGGRWPRALTAHCDPRSLLGLPTPTAAAAISAALFSCLCRAALGPQTVQSLAAFRPQPSAPRPHKLLCIPGTPGHWQPSEAHAQAASWMDGCTRSAFGRRGGRPHRSNASGPLCGPCLWRKLVSAPTPSPCLPHSRVCMPVPDGMRGWVGCGGPLLGLCRELSTPLMRLTTSRFAAARLRFCALGCGTTAELREPGRFHDADLLLQDAAI